MSVGKLEIRLFGSLQVTLGGEPIPRVRSRSVEWLLALLVLRGGEPVSRSWLAGTLWPESSEEQALLNLRVGLMRLRDALGEEAARIAAPDRRTLRFDLTGAFADTAAFDAAIRSGDEDALRSAVELYRGPLLEDCYSEWTLVERNMRAEQYLAALETLAERAEARGDYRNAVTHLRLAAAHDPLRDSIVRRLMTCLAAIGDPAAAIEIYRNFRIRLQEELTAAPDEETVRLFQEIRAASRNAARSEQTAAETSVTAPRTPLPSHPAAAPIPRPLTHLIGREEELREIQSLLQQNRLVTLVGGGGVGKTRLALEAAALVAETCSGGAIWIELAPLADGALILPTIAAALGLSDDYAEDNYGLEARIVARLSTGTHLLALDNCEHLRDASALAVHSLLLRCPDLRVLATSRQRLGLTGEVVWRVPSLPAPDLENLAASEESLAAHLMQYPSVQLFTERAAMVKPGFQLTEQAEALLVAQICQRLDGIPLAIELAATRVGFLTLPQIAERLNDRFRLLTDGSRGVLTRHQTLRALIDWSYDLLTEPERALLRRLSVFVDGWTLEDAEAQYAGEEAWDPASDTFELLASLNEKSLVLAEERNGELRYRMLETVREYSLEKLRQQAEEETVRNQHLAYFLHLAEKAAQQWNRSGQEMALARVESEIGNFRAALAWAQQKNQSSDAYLRLAAALWPFWELRGYSSEGRAHLRVALNHPERLVSLERAQALLGAATLASIQFDVEEALTVGLSSLEQFRLLGDRRGTAAALLCLGNAYIERRDLEAAHRTLTEGLDCCRQCGWIEGMATALAHLGRVAFGQGDIALSRSLLEQGLAQAEAQDDARLTAHLLHNLAYVVLESGDAARARVLQEKSLDIRRRIGYKRGIADALNSLGRVAQQQGEFTQALTYHQEAAALYRELGNPAHICNVLYQIGYVFYALGDYPRASSALEACLEVFRSLDYIPHLSGVFNHLGSALFHLGDRERARALHREALSLYLKQDDREDVIWTLERFAVLDAACGNAPKSACLLGAASAARAELATPMTPWDRADWEAAFASVGAALGEAEFARLRAEGSVLPLEKIVAMVLEDAETLR